MKTSERRSIGPMQDRYVSPEANVIDITAQVMLCQSGSTIKGLNPLEDDSDNWGTPE